jgi:very-short-patch-repair endonuclease
VRRQVAYGPYVLDFAVLAAKLAIEVDGESHTTDHGLAHDVERTAWLELRGWRVIRFTNAEVLGNLEGVLTTLMAVLVGDPHPGPLPTGEGEKC